MLSLSLSLQFPLPLFKFKHDPCSSSSSSSSSSSIIHDDHSKRLTQSNAPISSSCPPKFVKLLATTPLASSSSTVATEGEEIRKKVVVGIGEKQLPVGLRQELMPKHVAVIMDGNRRWAKQRGLPTCSGHRAGAESLKEMVQHCRNWGIKVLTVFAFSTENWKRSTEEIDTLMSLSEEFIKSNLESTESESDRNGMRLTVMGDLSKLSKSQQETIKRVELATKANTHEFHLIIAFNYSGQYDVVQACKRIAEQVKKGLVQPQDINGKLVEENLLTNCTEFPYPDLLIRSSGEIRVSNFMLWQLAYTELYFVDTLWPDFRELEFVEALSSFQQRKRN